MRTTIRLDEALLQEAKRTAVATGRTLTAVIEDALRETLARRSATAKRPYIHLTTSEVGGGLQPGVDLDDTVALLDLMERSDGPA